jgi:hypothetical protein
LYRLRHCCCYFLQITTLLHIIISRSSFASSRNRITNPNAAIAFIRGSNKNTNTDSNFKLFKTNNEIKSNPKNNNSQ